MTSAQNKNGRYEASSGLNMFKNNSDLEHSSKNNPCPICDRTKDADCSWSPDASLVLCYSEGEDGRPVQAVGDYYFNGQYSDSYHGANTRAQYTKQKPRNRTSTRKLVHQFKPEKQQTRDINSAIVEIEVKVDDLALMVAEGHETPASAQVNLAAWCKEKKHDKYAASQLLKAKLKEASDQGIQGTSDEDPRWLREYRLVEQKFGDRLRFNQLTKQVELDAETFDATTAKMELGINRGLKLKGNREDLTDTIVMLAKKNAYSPVVDYLQKVHQQYGDSTDVLNGFAQRHLGISNPIHEALVRRFLIAAVARALSPGCKHDCALILQGPQGCGKSTFFKALASEAWFDDSLGSTSHKDEKLKLHQFWIVEWPELETVFRRTDVSQVKAFMSSSIDNVRPSYCRNMETLKRPSVIVGTTNQEQFLADTTGNRRFWVVPITHRLDMAKLRAERDRIWAAAVTLYQSGEQWWLTDQEGRQVDGDRNQFEEVHPWLEPIQDYVAGLSEVTTASILSFGVKVDISRQNNGDTKKVAGIMKKLGWEPKNNVLSQQGHRSRGWIKN